MGDGASDRDSGSVTGFFSARSIPPAPGTGADAGASGVFRSPGVEGAESYRSWMSDAEFVTPRDFADADSSRPPRRPSGAAAYASSDDAAEYFSSREPGSGVEGHARAGEEGRAGDGGRRGDRLGAADVLDLFSLARHCRVAELNDLLDAGVPVDATDGHGNTALHIACQNGHKRIVKAVLRRGADINCQNLRGNTPAHFCFAYGFGELGEYLIEKGASVSIRNSAGLLPHEGIG